MVGCSVLGLTKRTRLATQPRSFPTPAQRFHGPLRLKAGMIDRAGSRGYLTGGAAAIISVPGSANSHSKGDRYDRSLLTPLAEEVASFPSRPATGRPAGQVAQLLAFGGT